MEATLGNAAEARRAAGKALALSSGRDVRKVAAQALAQTGDSSGALKQIAALNKEFPLDTLVHELLAAYCPRTG